MTTRDLTRRLCATAALGAALILGGCAGGPGSGESSGDDASPVGTWGSEDAGSPNLTLVDDGTVSGTDGCNRLSGSWTQDGPTVTFERMISTLMACEGVDTWLSQVSTATLDGDVLTVLDQSGAEIGTLERADD